MMNASMRHRKTWQSVLAGKHTSVTLNRFLLLTKQIMKLNSVIVLTAGLGLAMQVAVAGDITGTVKLNGTPPAEKDITPLKEDPACGKLHSSMPTTHFYEVGSDKGLADAVVMLKGVPAKSADASAPPVVLDQKGCEYTPQILAIQTGQKLIVRNSDAAPVAMHNVHMNPTAEANVAANTANLNVAQMAGAADLTVTFPAPENFMKFQCDVHRWMFAWVTVVDNPYFAVTDKDGKFTIKNVPPGTYKIVALHRKAAPQGVEQDVNVTDAGGKADFTLEVK